MDIVERMLAFDWEEVGAQHRYAVMKCKKRLREIEDEISQIMVRELFSRTALTQQISVDEKLADLYEEEEQLEGWVWAFYTEWFL